LSEVEVRKRLQAMLDPKPEDYFAHLLWKYFLAGSISLQVNLEGKLAIGLTPIGEDDAEKILQELQT